MSSRTDSVSSQQWALLQRIFDQALEVPEDTRDSFIDTACQGDQILRKQVDALIRAAEADEELVGDLIRTAADQVLEKSPKTRKQIGAFKIVDVIGTGGMGVVYLGQRSDREFDQQVAIKILHDELGSDEALLRFRTERQILADLNHPNIARLLDGGQTEDGLPYLVMEYIDGVPLVEYCDQRRLGIDERLDLFKQVCAAVAVAHRSLVVHRDLKPGNILVDSEGTPKLLDFGIAKVLSNRFQPTDLAKTQLGERLLTPDYASPEQVQGLPITTSSDIYSLGVLLYQLLCGTRPFRLVDKTPAEMEKIILNDVPLPPSQAIGTVLKRSEGARAIAADRRGLTADALQKKLAGELDYIVLMALKKEPQRRYVSASQLASDLTRYQQGLPIAAVKDTRRYHARKFFQRNRIPVTAAAVLLVSLLGFSIMSYQQARAIAVEKSVSENSLDFLTEVFRASTPGELQKEVVTAMDILDVGAARVETQLNDQPAPRATLQRIIGLAYASNQNAEKAFEHLESSLETRTELYGIDHPFSADVLQNLGDLYLAQGNVEKARPLFEQALAVYRNSVSRRYFRGNNIKRQGAIQNALGDLAAAHRLMGEFEIAEGYFREAIEIAKGLEGSEQHVNEEPGLMERLSNLLQERGRYAEADEMLEAAMVIARRRFGDDSLMMARLVESLAMSQHAQDNLIDAEELYRKAMSIREGKLAPSAPVVLASKRTLGRLLRDRQQPEEALVLLEEVVEQNRKYFGDPLPFSSGTDLVELSRVLINLGQFEEAESLLDEAWGIYVRTSGKRDARYAEVLREQGNLYVAMGRPDVAITKFGESVTLLRDMFGDDYWQTAANISEKAEAHMALGQHAEAKHLLDASEPVLHRFLGPDHRLSRAATERRGRLEVAVRSPDAGA